MCVSEECFVQITEENAAVTLNGPVPPALLRVRDVLFHFNGVRHWVSAEGQCIGWGRLDDLVDNGELVYVLRS